MVQARPSANSYSIRRVSQRISRFLAIAQSVSLILGTSPPHEAWGAAASCAIAPPSLRAYASRQAAAFLSLRPAIGLGRLHSAAKLGQPLTGEDIDARSARGLLKIALEPINSEMRAALSLELGPDAVSQMELAAESIRQFAQRDAALQRALLLAGTQAAASGLTRLADHQIAAEPFFDLSRPRGKTPPDAAIGKESKSRTLLGRADIFDHPKVRALDRLAARYAGLSGRQYQIPPEKAKLAQEWHAAQKAAPIQALDQVFLAESGRVYSFYATGDKTYAVALDPSGAHTARFEQIGEATPAQILRLVPEPGALLPISDTGNMLDWHPDDFLYPQGEITGALKGSSIGGDTMDLIKSALMGIDDFISFSAKGEGLFSKTFETDIRKLLKLSSPETDLEPRLKSFLRARIYHNQLKEFLRSEERLLSAIMTHGNFRAWGQSLESAFHPAYGFSDQMIAEKILIAAFMNRFGRYEAYARVPEFEQTLEQVAEAVRDSGYGRLLLPRRSESAGDAAKRQREAIAGLAAITGRPATLEAANSLKRLGSETALRKAVQRVEFFLNLKRSWFERTLARAAETIGLIARKVEPHSHGDRLDAVERFYRQAGVENVGGFSNAARYRYTSSRLFSGTGYFPEHGPLQPIETAQPSQANIRDSLRHMLVGNKTFDAFETKFANERPLVARFLATTPTQAFPELPGTLRTVIRPEFVLTDMMDTESPVVISRFHKTYDQWERTAWDRISFDFVRGVEIQLLRRTNFPRFLLRLVTNWKSEDFSKATDADIDWAIDRTLRIGRIRAKKLNNEPRAISEYRLKDGKDLIKKVLFQHLPKTKFLQNDFTWASYFGCGWSCMCWYRESLFRVTFKK